MTDKDYRIELRRIFLIEDLPEPLTRASPHWQIFDNYIENTRLRLRSVRVPETKEWTWILEQHIRLENAACQTARIYLSEAEHSVFEMFEGRQIRRNEKIESPEIRKNRYFYEFGGRQIEFDVFLGDLWGLNCAQVIFENIEELENYEPLSFFVREISNNQFFSGENLVGKSFADVQAEFEKYD